MLSISYYIQITSQSSDRKHNQSKKSQLTSKVAFQLPQSRIQKEGFNEKIKSNSLQKNGGWKQENKYIQSKKK